MVKRTLIAAAAVGVAVAALGSISSSADVSNTRTLKLIDTGALIDTFIDEGTTGTSTGDTEVFRDNLLFAKDRRPAGHADGKCTLIDPSTGQFECVIVTVLADGTITTEGIGVLVPGHRSTAAVTGGTGTYEDVGGHATLDFNPPGESAVAFTLIR